MVETLTHVQDTTAADIQRLFDAQKKNQYSVGNSTASERKAKLQKLHDAVLRYRTDIQMALKKDYGKHPAEVDMTEIYPVTSELKHTKGAIHSWLKNHSVPTPMGLIGSSSFVKYEPKGVVLIISPWNFPINLTFGPLVSAIAAGNTVILKPSEMTPNASAIMKKIITELFDENEVALVEGGIETSQILLSLPFNHIFFTGAPSVGKVVMAAAAKNLTSVTLELGGKSPTIVDETANIDTAASRIAWAKYTNNGQICIAPDYLYVHNSQKDAFMTAFKQHLKTYYADDASQESSYGRIVNNRHFNRIKSYVDDAVLKGARVELGGKFDEADKYISPTVVTQANFDSKLMENEIFGPVLPVFFYDDINAVINDINGGEKPLALYVFSSSNKKINHIINNTRAGGGCINHCSVHYFNTHLPFGGSNNSGIGKAHGFEGFKAFANARGILRQNMPNALELLKPPYNNFKERLIDWTIKYF